MNDLIWLTNEAKQIHGVFEGVFFSLAVLLIVVGVLAEYFKFPLGGTMPSPLQLIGRTFVAGVLLVGYPEIANMIAGFTDALAAEVGDLNSFDNILQKTAAYFETASFSWVNIGDSLAFIVSYLSFGLLYVTVFIFDAAIAFAWLVLYIFSPLLIVMFILPTTAQATSGLFRSLFEVACWKVVFSVLGTLLWSSGLHYFEIPEEASSNSITILAFTIMLALSILMTPAVVRSLAGKGLSAMAATFSGGATTILMSSVAAPVAAKVLGAKAAAAATTSRGLATLPIVGGAAFAKRALSQAYSVGSGKKDSSQVSSSSAFQATPSWAKQHSTSPSTQRPQTRETNKEPKPSKMANPPKNRSQIRPRAKESKSSN